MYLMRNFASWTKMKSHDMNGDGMLDCCSTWFGGSAGSFFRSRDLVQDRLPIRKDRLDIMMSADSRMAWRHDSRMNMHDWNLKFHDMETWMASDGSGGGDGYRIAIWDGFLKNNYYFGIWNVKIMGWHQPRRENGMDGDRNRRYDHGHYPNESLMTWHEGMLTMKLDSTGMAWRHVGDERWVFMNSWCVSEITWHE